MNRGLKLVATFWLLATAIAAGQLLRALIFPVIEQWGRRSPVVGSVVVTLIAVAPLVLVLYLTRAWRRDLLILLRPDYWNSMLESGVNRVRALARPVASASVRNRTDSALGGVVKTRGFLVSNRVALLISLALALVALAIAGSYLFLRDRSDRWVTFRNPKYTTSPSPGDRMASLQIAFESMRPVLREVSRVHGVDRDRFWSDSEYRNSPEVANIQKSEALQKTLVCHSFLDEQIATVAHAIEEVEFKALIDPSDNLSQSTRWRMRFKLPTQVRPLVEEITYCNLQVVAIFTLTDQDGYVLDTAELPVDDSTLPDLGRWSCLSINDQESRLRSLGPILVFKGSDEGHFHPREAKALDFNFALKSISLKQQPHFNCVDWSALGFTE